MVDHDLAYKVVQLLHVANCPVFTTSFAIYAISGDGETAFDTELIRC